MEPLLIGAAALAVIAVAVRSKKPNRRPPTRDPRTRPQTHPRGRYPGDFKGRVNVSYAPHPDGRADPGEIVWTWVPFEEDHHKGKDRPVLIIGRADGWLLGLQLTSKDHDADAAHEARYGRRWMDIGTGAWDRQRRPSEVRLDRIIRVDPASVRREGAVLDRRTFDSVAHSLSELHHW
ncbi:type II toxin-antitoxin system PemK/MazF family toxin [Demequina sp.]|uniref:type II toxin-antitoxin system PemK/MazF family toxin n=1 Tax=Demequina sp. TaxID=2050685 RepID=UPI003A8BD402